MLKSLIKANSTQKENTASFCEEQFQALLGKLVGAHLLRGTEMAREEAHKHCGGSEEAS